MCDFYINLSWFFYNFKIYFTTYGKDLKKLYSISTSINVRPKTNSQKCVNFYKLRNIHILFTKVKVM